jgi:hypothetical protein
LSGFQGLFHEPTRWGDPSTAVIKTRKFNIIHKKGGMKNGVLFVSGTLLAYACLINTKIRKADSHGRFAE